jgi:hypothetical protein
MALSAIDLPTSKNLESWIVGSGSKKKRRHTPLSVE